jgi:hypothetical protein
LMDCAGSIDAVEHDHLVLLIKRSSKKFAANYGSITTIINNRPMAKDVIVFVIRQGRRFCILQRREHGRIRLSRGSCDKSLSRV